MSKPLQIGDAVTVSFGRGRRVGHGVAIGFEPGLVKVRFVNRDVARHDAAKVQLSTNPFTVAFAKRYAAEKLARQIAGSELLALATELELSR